MKIPIVGMGGIQNADDAIEFLMAGGRPGGGCGHGEFLRTADTVQVIARIREFMERRKISGMRGITGSVQTGK